MARFFTVATLLVLPLVASAQIVRDPTQPPAAYTTDGPQSTSGEQSDTPVLQSIIRRHGAKPVAMIDGQAIVLGGKLGERVLIRIGENEVWLKGADGTEKLTMSPDVDKRSVKPAIIRQQR